MARFTEEQMIHLVAYQNLYGPITPDRLDIVIARLGMDVTAPHMKKGKRPRLRDHLIQWSRQSRPQRSGRELLATIRGIQARYDRQEAAGQQRRPRRRNRHEGG
ncbi:phage tail assembly protein T [Streptomyces ipomoeae]|uniref:phage tail assembly protein T n=1 Tax=Streptomyces ipomoeae TaxID=103232 RepID=UPI001147434C|nr:hypothetical protein [Streptomyces ipomoeae]TQE35477.1 hypothetical protein Sipo7851_14545 [Streptomyces ipomoeae]